MSPAKPTYPLADIKACIAAGNYHITGEAGSGAAALGLDESDILACVKGLTDGEFYKTMPAVKRPGFFQDVYWPRYGGYLMYVKLQITPRDGKQSVAVIVQFKEK